MPSKKMVYNFLDALDHFLYATVYLDQLSGRAYLMVTCKLLPVELSQISKRICCKFAPDKYQ